MIRQHIQAARSNDAGFTLIELLIVVVILGVLSAVVVFAVSAFNNDGVAAACKTDIKSVEVASEAFYAKTGGHAADIAAMVTAGYLKEAPSTAADRKYTISYDAATGGVTGTVGAGGGAAC
jgi:prepilin-type N-terminal cleavage/methylation domain-containing protein